MAPHGKQMTPEEKQIIVALSQQGYSSYKIAEMTGKHRRTISKFLRRRRVWGSEENLPRSGRGRKTGVRGDKIMYRMLRSDRRQSLEEITDQFNRQFVTKISSRTINLKGLSNYVLLARLFTFWPEQIKKSVDIHCPIRHDSLELVYLPHNTKCSPRTWQRISFCNFDPGTTHYIPVLIFHPLYAKHNLSCYFQSQSSSHHWT